MGGLYGGYGIPSEDEVVNEVDAHSPGELKRDAVVDLARSMSRKYLMFNYHDTQHPDGSKHSVCALCAGNFFRKTGIPMPDDGLGNPSVNSANIWDQISGTAYAKKAYANTDFMKAKEYENWEIITDFTQVTAGDLLMFKGSGYDEMMAGNPTETNPSGYHMAVSSSDYSEPWGYFPGVSGGFSIVDDQGAGRFSPIKERNKYHNDLEQQFIGAARYVGP